MAAPSIAVGNIDAGPFASFGEITLLADPSMIEDKTLFASSASRLARH
jgi:hypothetical protein